MATKSLYVADSGGLEPPTPGSVGRFSGILEQCQSVAKLSLSQKTLYFIECMAMRENQREPVS